MSSEGGSGTGLSASDQARLRREKREKRILSQGNSRLERIAGLQGGAAAREALHPDPPEADISQLEEKKTEASSISSAGRNAPSSPRRDLVSVDGSDDDPFNMLRAGNDPMANVPDELKDDPLMRLLLKNPLFNQGTPSGPSAGVGPERESSAEDLTALAEKITRQLRGTMAGEQPPDQKQVGPDPSAWKWKSLRIIGVVTVLGYLWTQLEDFHFSRNVDSSYGLVFLFV
jgi:hypothetical protein